MCDTVCDSAAACPVPHLQDWHLEVEEQGEAGERVLISMKHRLQRTLDEHADAGRPYDWVLLLGGINDLAGGRGGVLRCYNGCRGRCGHAPTGFTQRAGVGGTTALRVGHGSSSSSSIGGQARLVSHPAVAAARCSLSSAAAAAVRCLQVTPPRLAKCWQGCLC